MPRFRSRRRRTIMAPIISVKNQRSEKQSVTPTANIIFEAVVAVEVGAGTKILGNEVPVGSKVYSMDVSVNFISLDAATTGNFEWYVGKLRNGQSVVDITPSPDWTNIGLSDGRNQVIKSFMALYGTEDAGAIRYNMHIKIPKIYQRVRAGDKIVIVTVSSSGGDLAVGTRYKYYQ